MSLLQLESLGYSYENKVMVLSDINFQFDEGKIYSIVGRSGAGKTTLLSLLSGLAKPTSGDILYKGASMKKIDRYNFRSQCVGVIFQSFNLLPHLTALENVVLSMEISKKKIDNKKEHAMQLLKKVGIEEDEANRKILKLSGGQQQRVAIARALSYSPDIILADEPTGNLDGYNQDEIMKIFRMLADEGKCIIIVTHSPQVAMASDQVYELVKTNEARQPFKQAKAK